VSDHRRHQARERVFPLRRKVGSSTKARSRWSDFGFIGKGNRVLKVNAEIAHLILVSALTEKNLDRPKVAGRPTDDRCIRSAK
jgi:hypothetical protein